MNPIAENITEYLANHKVCVLAVEMLDGSPHAATVHYANESDPLTFFFLTEKRYRKVEAVLERGKTRASLVVGSNEGDMRTFQTDGELRLVSSDEDKQAFERVYLGKHPKKQEAYGEEGAVALAFTPTWWRYTDWTQPEGKTVTLSE